MVILTLKVRPSSCSSESSNVPLGRFLRAFSETSSPKSMNLTMAFSKVLVPYFSASSTSRLAPMRTDAMAAQTSPSSTSGMRELTLMMSMTERIGWPFEMILIAGRRRPSWKISVASPVSEPGAMPPTSELWAMFAVQAIS